MLDRKTAEQADFLFAFHARRVARPPGTTRRSPPNTLTRAYQDADYFERNVRTIEVLIERPDRELAQNDGQS